jgi:6,7-dimethyl-8-ribityllumazine synthase
MCASTPRSGWARWRARSDIPVVFGVLTTDDLDQALARARDGADNKGFEAATTAVEMVGVFRAVAGR